LPRTLLALGKMPLYPEQPELRRQLSDEAYRTWIATVCRTIAGGVGDELRSVLPAVREAGANTSPPPAGLPVEVLASQAFGEQMGRLAAGAGGGLCRLVVSTYRHQVSQHPPTPSRPHRRSRTRHSQCRVHSDTRSAGRLASHP
jgi:hypothetical protein